MNKTSVIVWFWRYVMWLLLLGKGASVTHMSQIYSGCQCCKLHVVSFFIEVYIVVLKLEHAAG